jgi:hypothetical protein
MVPLLIASGAGAAARFAIGIVIAMGMTIGTLFTLFVTPAVYTYIARDHQKAKREEEAALASAGAVPAHVETPEEADQAAAAGMIYPAPPEPYPTAEPLSAEAQGISSAAEAVSSAEPSRRARRRAARRRRLAPAAE